VKCTSCGSDNVQRVQMAYEMGTQNISATSTGTIRGTSRTISSTSSGTQQTQLARRLAPPGKRSLNYAAGLVLAGILLCLLGLNLGTEVTRTPAAGVAQASHKLKKKIDKTDVALPSQAAVVPAAETRSIFGALTHPLFLAGILACIGGSAWSIRNRRWNRRQWPLLLAEWQRRWICHKCGTVFAQ
jgi:hypothetical protein